MIEYLFGWVSKRLKNVHGNKRVISLIKITGGDSYAIGISF